MTAADGGDRDDQTQARDAHNVSQPVIVCMGASAGGVQALQSFFGALPAETGAAYVVIVHLDPDRRSEMQSVLATRTRMRVVEVEDGAKLEADHVYVIPPDRQLELVDHHISAKPFAEPLSHFSVIDLLFLSVVERLGRVFVIILLWLVA